jgi:hypothetical protein
VPVGIDLAGPAHVTHANAMLAPHPRAARLRDWTLADVPPERVCTVVKCSRDKRKHRRGATGGQCAPRPAKFQKQKKNYFKKKKKKKKKKKIKQKKQKKKKKKKKRYRLARTPARR